MTKQHEIKAPSARLQKVILWIGAGTLISVMAGIGTMLYTSGRYTQGIEDSIKSLQGDVKEQRTDFLNFKGDCQKESRRFNIELSKTKQAIVAHTGKQINGNE